MFHSSSRPSLRHCSATALAAVVTMAGALVATGATGVAPAAAAAAPPTFLGTLAGASQAAMYPSGLDLDTVNDRLVIADTGRDRILFYSRTGTPLGGFGEYGTGPGQFASPRDATIDGAGNIYVADAENNRVQKFSSTGAFQWQRGGLGTGNETLNTPIGVTWDAANNVLLVASTGQSLVKAWNAAGVFQWKSPTGSSLGATGIRDASRGPDGRMWVTAYSQHQIKAYDVSPAGVWVDTIPEIVLGDGAANGSGVNQLNFPYNVVWSADGNTIYVSDTGNGRITRWDLSGPSPQWLAPFGGRCDNHPQPCADPPLDAGKFNHLRRVTIDGAGNVYGADFWGAGIEVFDPNGAVVRSIEGNEPPAPGFAEAYGVDVAPSGQVYVMDRLNHRIQRFSAAGAYLNKVGARGTQPATFSWPEGLTVGPDGSVWALDTRGGRIERFSADLAATGVPSYGDTGAAVGQFNYESGGDVDAAGVVWVADTRNHRLQKYDPTTGAFSVIGMQGSGPGQFSGPMGVAVTPTAVYVADTGNNRVQKLSLDGTHQATFSTGLAGPEGIDVAPDGTLWVADTQNNRLVHLSTSLVDLGDGFGSAGTGDHQFSFPHDLAFGNDMMYVADTYNNRVQTYSLPGPVDPPPNPLSPVYSAQISDPGGRAPFYPAGVAIADGTWYVADSGGSRVVTVDPTTGAVAPVATTGLTDPRDLEVDAADPSALWVVDTGGDRVVRLSRTGQQLGTFTGLTQPYGLTNDAARVYVANTYGNSVRAFTRAGATAWTQTTCGGVAFSRPRDVGLLDNGQVLVADTDNDRIAVLDQATGACVRTFGTRGTAVGQFKSPRSVTTDGAGGLWVADALNYRVQHLTATGGSLGASPVNAYGEGAAQFRSPHCVTRVPGTSQVAVCDTFNFRMSLYDGAGATPSYVRAVGGTKPANGGFNGPFAVAYGPDGSLYAADWFNHRIQKFSPTGDYVSQWGGYGPQNGSLIFPRGLLVTAAGDVVVTDSENNRLDVFTAAGAYLRQIKPTTGTALSRPHQTALDGSGGYWVADTNNSRVVHLGSAGAVLGSFPITGTAASSKPEGIAVDTDGTLLVSNTQNNRVERYSTSGTLLATVAGNGTGAGQVRKPGGLLVTGTGAARRLWIADAGNNRAVVLDAAGGVEAAFGSVGGGAGQLTQPRGIAVDPTDGDIAVADFGNDRLSLWRPDGPPPPVDTQAPAVAFTAPASGASLPAGAVSVTGTTSDNTSVSTVEVAIQRSSDGAWWQANGTWAATQQYVAATLAAPGATSSTWSLPVTASTAGTYSMTARAVDQAGNTGQTMRSFSVIAADTVAPDGTMTSPANNASVPIGPIVLRGAASDNVGVASVLLGVQDAVTKQWLRPNGTFATGYANVTATLAAPNATTTTWSYTFTPPLARKYGISVIAKDAAGNQDPTKPWVSITVTG